VIRPVSTGWHPDSVSWHTLWHFFCTRWMIIGERRSCSGLCKYIIQESVPTAEIKIYVKFSNHCLRNFARRHRNSTCRLFYNAGRIRIARYVLCFGVVLHLACGICKCQCWKLRQTGSPFVLWTLSCGRPSCYRSHFHHQNNLSSSDTPNERDICNDPAN
jgi:hypothetical protein